jgi:ribose 5-phosphate isomerase B
LRKAAEVYHMKIAVGSDEKTYLTDFVVEELRKKGIEVELHGPLKGENLGWTDVAREVSERVSEGACDQGILFCWTGTGVSIAANKVPGVRAALCQDARTAEGARKWNDANVLAMGLRATSPVVAGEILDAWLSTGPDKNEKNNIDKISEIEKKYCR